MSLDACASLVQRGDPDRFLAVMAAPPAARAVLFPLYAFNLEVARAPQVTREPLIAEMRLQWWRDALAEIAEGRPVRNHEVTVPLAAALTPAAARGLDDLILARHCDIGAQPFADAAALMDYLDRTAGTLLWAGAQSLGAAEGEQALRAWGRAQGLANWFLACPALLAQGGTPLPDASGAGIAALAEAALKEIRAVRPPKTPVLLATWRAKALLTQARRHPDRVLSGRLAQSEFRRRGSLLWRSLAG
ncbi:squalene/phytoene synthase family protein [Frigidibacter sp. ROC022]|uniref:squalene/phytoene synthase family protein n=1 Tax=Frigidibacter sp. ROC022 TaxID=2971796 RepID=UPI00215AAC6B|nr:squalene/phytoene synthase family protein [Frigidibacter sp. ROC022]MCR8723260.1 squalene/phytoene synthase family protein [Frigidibacter sp. ROC022]